MTQFRPKYITFDCYGTLTNFDMAGAARRSWLPLSARPMAQFIKDFSAYRLDEVLGAWKPYVEVVENSVERTCKRNGVAFGRRMPSVSTRKCRPGGRTRTSRRAWPRSPRRSRS